jgi:RNA polymerase sigma-70 factor (ECF subfamily)
VALSDVFVRVAGEFQRELKPSPELDRLLCTALATARTAYPDVSVDDEAYLRHLLKAVPAGADPLEVLPRLALADLYLACACCLGDARAIARFEREFVRQVSAYVGRAGALAGFDDEVKQALRNRILVAETSLLPRIASYSGKGPLGAWVRMTATRIAADLRRESGRARPGDGDLLSAVAPDPELSYLKRRYGAECSRAVELAFRELSEREANLMRLYFLEQSGAAVIAAMYGVTARSVQRWIAATQAQLLASTKRILKERLALSTGELDSLLGLVESQLGVSVYRLLGAPHISS